LFRSPPSADWKRPAFDFVAPVKAPFSYPKSSLSISVGTSDPQSTATNGVCAIEPRKWRARAASSFPVPLSPEMSTGVRVSLSREIMRSTSWMCDELPMMPSRLSAAVTLAQKLVFRDKVHFFRHALQQQAHFLHAKRFFDVVVGPQLHGVHGGFDRSMPGHD